MAIKKSQLYSTLWESCNALRGSMDASQYKDYVLMILFVKYLSDKAEKGERLLTVPEGCFFRDFVLLKQSPNIGEEINKKLEKIKENNAPFIGSLTLPNFNDPAKLGEGKTMVETLSKLIGVFENDALDFSKNRTADDDLLGDAYEYLMKNFAAESGKSKGQFYTPAEVSRIIAQVLDLGEFTNNRTTIYDPTCGSGSLLLRAMAETNTGRASLYGQEKDSTTAALAQLNMLLHGINNAKIMVGDTLNDPQFKEMGNLRTFDVVVANPPFSQKNWLNTGGENDEYNRWNAELLPPAKCGDYAFLLHILRSMKAETGRGACILPHGVLFRGNAEAVLRERIVKKHIIKGIIGLPANLFFGTGIPASIIVMDKNNTAERKGIFFIDAKDGFAKDGAKNRLREQDIKRIIDNWDALELNPHYQQDHYARMVTWKEIEDNGYNLNIPRYIAPRDTEIHQSIPAHLQGGLPTADIDNMSTYWDACPTLRDALFATTDKQGMSNLKVSVEQVDKTIQSDASFQKQGADFAQAIQQWADCNKVHMKAISTNVMPKALISNWSEQLLEAVPAHSLVSKYTAYDHLMNYWAETMQDDCYMISNDGWVLSPVTSSKKKGIYSDLVCDLLPVDILLREYFEKELKVINQLLADKETKEGEQDALIEEHPDDFDDSQFGEKGFTSASLKNRLAIALIREELPDERLVLSEALTIVELKGKKKKNAQEEMINLHSEIFQALEGFTKSAINKRLKELNNRKPALADSIEIWSQYVSLDEQVGILKNEIKTRQTTLTEAVIAKYESLTTDELKTLVVERKWLATILARCQEEMNTITNNITNEVTALYNRYADTLGELTENSNRLEATVMSHLAQMGFSL